MSLRIGVVGCTHGELDVIYRALDDCVAQIGDGRPVDLLICCGDFQACRNEGDLSCMSCPDKYLDMHEFFMYYNGAVEAPVPTLFIGGNHEAANHSAELPLGGWVAPRIWYMGSSGVVNFGGLRIGGISGIYKAYSFWLGYHERPPYSEDDQKSICHQRAFDFWRMAHCCPSGGAGGVSGETPAAGGLVAAGAGSGSDAEKSSSSGAAPMDVFLTHDWPAGVTEYGDKDGLLRQKPFFAEDVARGQLGSPPAMQLLHSLRPRFWFSGHLHVKFSALVPHFAPAAPSPAAAPSTAAAAAPHAPPTQPRSFTRFLALDKPEGRKPFLQVLDIPLSAEATASPPAKAFHYDTQWCATLAATHAATPLTSHRTSSSSGGSGGGGWGGASSRGLPPPLPPSREALAATAAALARSSATACGAQAAVADAAAAFARAHPFRPVPIPANFHPCAPPHTGGKGFSGTRVPVFQQGNPQMDAFLAALGLPHATTVPFSGGEGGGSGSGSGGGGRMGGGAGGPPLGHTAALARALPPQPLPLPGQQPEEAPPAAAVAAAGAAWGASADPAEIDIS